MEENLSRRNVNELTGTLWSTKVIFIQISTFISNNIYDVLIFVFFTFRIMYMIVRRMMICTISSGRV